MFEAVIFLIPFPIDFYTEDNIQPDNNDMNLKMLLFSQVVQDFYRYIRITSLNIDIPLYTPP